MIHDDGFNPHRWIILHVALTILSKANAQSFTPSPPESQPGQTQSRTTVVAVLVTIFFLAGLLSVYIRQCTRSDLEYSPRYFNRGANDGCSRRGGLDDSIVESFPVFAYSFVKESKIGSGNLECSICLNELEDRETVRLLPICNHLFHIDCIDAWLYSHATCPVCRCNLTEKSEKSSEENDGPPSAMRDHVTIDIDGDSETVEAAKSDHQRTNFKTSGKFPRSNSTGHSMDRLNNATEKYTLRLPNDVKKRIMAVKGYKLKRTRSFDVSLTTEGSGKFRRSGEGNSYTVGSGRESGRVGSGRESGRVGWRI